MQGKLTMGDGEHMYTIGDAGFDNAGDLDALAIAGLHGLDADDFVRYL